MTEKNCKYCNEPLDNKRIDAKYHSKCKQKVYRERKHKEYIQSIKDLYNIQ